MIDQAAMMKTILDHACPGPPPDEDGFSVYYIEAHCVAFKITARPRTKTWDIKSFEMEDC